MSETYISKNFTQSEMACPCCDVLHIDPGFLEKLQELRDRFNRPMFVNSGYRCRERNFAVNGVKGSKHMEGLAADISTLNWNAKERYRFMQEAFDLGFTGVGVARTYIHLDTREADGVTWVYS